MKYLVFALALIYSVTGNSKELKLRVHSASITAEKNDTPKKGFADVRVEIYSNVTGNSVSEIDLWFMDNSYQVHLVTDNNGYTQIFLPTGKKKLITQKVGSKEKVDLITKNFHEDSTYIIKGNLALNDLEIIEVEPPVMVEKPVVYIYSEEDSTPFDMSIFTKSQLSFVYPAAQEQVGENELHYNLTINKDGTIISDGKEYPYLFWDGRMPLSSNFDEGFIVGRDTLVQFLEAQLTSIGLNEREKTDFITYWAPRMQKRDQVCMKFIFNNDYHNTISSHKYSTKPDSELRMFMTFTYTIPTSEDFIPYQEFPKFEREGLTIVEWGGSEISILQKAVGVKLNK